MGRGRFITLEGSEGAGKSTNIGVAERCLSAMGVDVVVTREPGGTPLAEEIRSVLLSTREEAVDPLTETLLMFAARAQHLAKVVKPGLAAGRWVLCERFTDATHAYQGGGRGLESGQIDALAGLVHPGFEPDLTLYLDLPVEQALARISGRALDRFERERLEFFERVRARYLELARANPRIRVIDAGRSPAEVAEEIEARLQDFRNAP
ncbi:MAG: dTMP kinase [Gammaproteobacteria bacterium]|nr:dTMP kinase [Gammaproteobacteria bacterium]